MSGIEESVEVRLSGGFVKREMGIWLNENVFLRMVQQGCFVVKVYVYTYCYIYVCIESCSSIVL